MASYIRSDAPILETQLLIVGAGPAGASLACFLARGGLTGLMISSAPGSAETPRAHITSAAALECLRDIDLYDECLRVGVYGDGMKHFRWCESMAGEEYGRLYTWGNGNRTADYSQVSPCVHMDLPQNRLEPILVKYATDHGIKMRFDTQLLGFEEDELGKYVCEVRDTITGAQYWIRTEYLFGADGGKSVVAEQLQLPMHVEADGGRAFNIRVKADLSHLMSNRQGNLHWCMRLEKDTDLMCVARMVKPWQEWLFVFFPKDPRTLVEKKNDGEWVSVVKEAIGDPNVEIEVFGTGTWWIQETHAEIIAKGKVFCLGDSIHRHPPTLGMGSNTCIQDAFNLAWKVDLVIKGKASPSLLHTYNTERQPIAADLVKSSNLILRKAMSVWKALGMQPPGSSEEQRLRVVRTMKEDSKDGRAARRLFSERLKDLHHETHALGFQRGQLYTGSAIYTVHEPAPFVPSERELQDPILHYDPTTYPGRRFPHAWLRTAIPNAVVSTIDLAGKGRFSLFTGIGGLGWKHAANEVERNLKIHIEVILIGNGLDWEDMYLEWEERRGVEENGAVLVRPDLFVAWRAQESGNELKRLTDVMNSILGTAKKM